MSVAKVSRAKAVLNSFGHKPCNCPSKVASKQGPSFVHVVAGPLEGELKATDAILSIEAVGITNPWFHQALVGDFDGDGMVDLVIRGVAGGTEVDPVDGTFFFFGSGQ